jgi:hypothetical protein
MFDIPKDGCHFTTKSMNANVSIVPADRLFVGLILKKGRPPGQPGRH